MLAFRFQSNQYEILLRQMGDSLIDVTDFAVGSEFPFPQCLELV